MLVTNGLNSGVKNFGARPDKIGPAPAEALIDRRKESLNGSGAGAGGGVTGIIVLIYRKRVLF